MKNIFIFGTGKSSEIVEKALLKENTNIIGYLDNNKIKQGKEHNSIPVVSPSNIAIYDYDYVIIAVLKYDVIMEQLYNMGIKNSKVIAFFSDEYIGKIEYQNIISTTKWIYLSLKQKYDVSLEKMEIKVNSYLNNVEYEVIDRIKNNKYQFPIVKSIDECLKKIIDERCSLSRFGDGEFEIMAGKVRPKFQHPNPLLAKRLTQIIKSNLKNHIVAIANNYGSLDIYDESASMGIREYMTPEVRKFHMEMLDIYKIYYDAYISRPYLMYKDKEGAFHRFHSLKRIWENRNIVIIEGDKTRMGVGNDLFANAKKINRILAPNENAFDKYDEILSVAQNIERDSLILIALGPTATVLAYDLTQLGYQAIDIGHIDIEYEWFLNKDVKRTKIKGKYINEIPNGEIVEEIDDVKYRSQIINTINFNS